MRVSWAESIQFDAGPIALPHCRWWWEAAAEQAENDPQWGSAGHRAPDIGFDQRIAWQVGGLLAPDTWRVASGGHSPGIRQRLGCDSAGLSAICDACQPESGD